MRATTVNVLEEEFACEVALSASSVFWCELEDVFRERKGSSLLFPGDLSLSPLNFFSENPNGLLVRPSDLDAEDKIRKAFADIVKPFTETTITGAEVGFQVSRQTPSCLAGSLEMKVHVRVRKTNYEFVFPREYKLINILPAVPSKFTLFVKHISNPEMFNGVQKTFQQDSGPQRILVLHNTNQPFSSTDTGLWRKSGWIFLGGSKVVINLDGTHPCRKESEFFLFWPTIYFGAGNQNTEIPYFCSPLFENTQLRVRTMPIGCCTEWANPAAGLSNIIGNTIVETVNNSSVLRLFGEKNHMTPTRVFGNVFARYILYSTLIFDSNGDGVADFISDPTGTSQKAVFPIPRAMPNEYTNPSVLPRMINAGGFDLFSDGAGTQGVPDSLADVMPAYSAGAPSDYVNHMTKLSTDFLDSCEVPYYNSLYDQMFDWSNSGANRSFPAKQILGQSEKEYPNLGTEFALPADQEGDGTLWKGSLQTYDPISDAKNLMDGVAFRFANQEEFFADDSVRRLPQGVLLRKPLVVHIDGDLDLSPEVFVAAPVAVVVSGNVRLGRVRRATPAGKLIVLSLAGNIEATGGKIEACLLAPKGSIRLSAPLDLVGTLFVDSLEPSQLSKFGGSVIFDPDSDPTNPDVYNRFFTVVLGPQSALVGKKQ